MKDFYVANAAKAATGEQITSFFAVTSRQTRKRRTGEPFLALTLADKTGQMEARMWDGVETVPAFAPGVYVKVQGCVEMFNDRPQFIVKRLRVAEPSEIEMSDYLPATSRDVDEMWGELEQIVDDLHDENLRELLTSFLDDSEIEARLRRAPAARSLHHAWVGGLLEHKLELVRLCQSVAPLFPEIQAELLITGAILHDIGKIHELTYETAFEYSAEGNLLGHISIGQQMLTRKLDALPDFPPRLANLLQHMILSHHGHFEFGSPKLPMTAEAMMLHMLDDLCAKMELFRGELGQHASAGDAALFTGWIRALQRPILDSRAYLVGRSARAAEITSPQALPEEPTAGTTAVTEQVATGDAQRTVANVLASLGLPAMVSASSIASPTWETISEEESDGLPAED